MNNSPTVSIIVPCRNEEKFIGKCLDSILAQDCPLDKLEVLAVDAMSDDGTRNILNEYVKLHTNIRVIDNPEKITPKAFNLGIENSCREIIAIVSAHSAISRDYISKCIDFLDKTGADNVGGPMRAVGNNYISNAIALAYSSFFGLGGGKFHNDNWEGKADTVYPGCWPRRVFKKVGLFDERLIRNQDIEFNSRIRKSGGKVFLTPEIKSQYYCRSSLKGLWKQNFRNGYWNIKTIKIAPGSLSLRHFVPLFFVSSLFIAWIIPLLWMSIVLSYVFGNIFFSFKIALKNELKYFLIMPIVFFTLHFSYGLGSIWGLLKEAKQ